MIDVGKLLYEICEDDAVFDDDCDLVESGLLDSFALIELVDRLEDCGVKLHLTRIDRTMLKTPRGIRRMIEEQSALSPVEKA